MFRCSTETGVILQLFIELTSLLNWIFWVIGQFLEQIKITPEDAGSYHTCVALKVGMQSELQSKKLK